jgi:hypothetical protein
MQHDISENTKYIHNLLKSYKIKSKWGLYAKKQIAEARRSKAKTKSKK